MSRFGAIVAGAGALVRVVALACAVLLAACSGSAPSNEAGAPTGIRFLADGAEDGFARARTPRAFEFPADHGSHPEFRTEWWYFTGNLLDAGGRHFGFELTFFRVGFEGRAEHPKSSWATQQIWMAHFALTDTARERFVAAERLSRGALDLAGAQSAPFRVWVEDWSAEALSGVLEEGLKLRAEAEQAGLDLRLRPTKPHVAQGDAGLDAKGPEPGNASFYYSLPRMTASGSVRDSEGEAWRVEGEAWMDREWSTSSLSPDVEGWDWFALQLDDGRDVMLYRLRERGGGTSPFSGGSLVGADGAVVRLGPEDFELDPRRSWTSQASGVTYPVAWTVRLPGHGLELDVTPRLESQELRLSVRYWEGAVQVSGTDNGAPIGGHGYLELAGY